MKLIPIDTEHISNLRQVGNYDHKNKYKRASR